MKRKITFLLSAFFALMLITQSFTVKGQSNYTITFGTGSGDGTSASTSTACSTIVSAGSGYLSGNLVTATKVYYNGDYGVKIGASSDAGVLKMNLSTDGQAYVTTVVVRAKRYNSSKAATIAVNGKTAQGTTGSFADYTFTINDDITYLQLNASKYLWVESIVVNYTTYTVTYDCNNATSGCPDPSTITVKKGASISLAAAPSRTDYTFNGWKTGETTYAAGASYTVNVDVTFTAQWTATGDYITVDPTTKNVTCAAQNAEFTITTDQTLDANPVVFYTNSDGDETTTKPSWIGDLTSAYSSSTLTIPVTANTGDARTAYFRVEKDEVQSDVITINQAVYSPSAPTLPAAGNFDYTKEITITVPSGTTVYYTTNGDAPTSSSPQYTEPFTISAAGSTTVKAIAYDNGYPSAVVSATYTRVYETMSDITSTTGTHKVKGTVVAKNTKGFIVADHTGYMYYYKNGAPSQVIDAVVEVSGGLTNYGHVIEFNSSSTVSSTSSSTYTSGTPTLIDGDFMYDVLSAGTTRYRTDYQEFVGDLVKDGSTYNITVKGASYNVTARASYATDDQNTVLENLKGKTVKVRGYYAGDGNDIYYVMLGSVEAVPVITTTESSLTGFNYNVGSGPSTSQSFNVNASNLKANITVALSNTDSFEMSEDNSTFSTDDITIDKGEGTVTNKTIYVRLKAGLSSGTFTPNITLSSTDAENKTVTLNGTVTAPYTINLSQNTGGTISANKETASAGETITLSVDLDDCYNFTSWTVLEDDLETPVSVSNNQFTMPSCDVYVEASFTQKTFIVTYSFNGEDIWSTSSITCGSTTTLLTEDDLETLEVVIPSGFYFVGWSETENSSTTVSSPYEPSATTTLYAVLTYGQAEAYYARVTSDLGTNWAGDYLIAYSNTIFADGRKGGTDDGCIGKVNVHVDLSSYISGNNIPATNGDTYKVTLEEIAQNSNTYVLKTQDGKYNYQSSNSNGLVATTNKSTAADYPITITFTNANDIKLSLGGSASGAVFRYNTGGYFRYYKDGGQSAVYLYKRTTTEVPNFNEVTNVTSTQTINTDISANECVIVSNNAILTFEGENNGTAANIVVNDGSQLITTNPVAATFNKSIDAPAAKTEYNSWYTISSPVTDGTHDYIAIASLPSLTAVDYDMLAYDEVNHTWRNQKNIGGASGFSNMDKGQGYMYRNDDSDISFVGTTNTGTFSNNLSYTAGAGDLAGFHLVGNPYSHNITLMNTTLLDDGGDPYETQLGGCYILTNTNSWGVSLGTSSPIKPTQGFLIQITTDDVKKIQFSETPRAAKSRSNGDNIEFIVSNSEYEDNTFALFDNVMGLNKIDHRNTEVPMIYIPQYGTNYAIAPMSDDTQMFGLNFKAATMGQYTLSMKAAGEYNYIHVIDRLTGEDIDMLLEGKYSFIGSPRDNESRFLVKLGYVPGSTNNNNEIFAYQSGSDIVVTGSGELQIFDVTGRSVMTTTINGVETIQVPTTGMYIFRLIGSDVKTQKIVVE